VDSAVRMLPSPVPSAPAIRLRYGKDEAVEESLLNKTRLPTKKGLVQRADILSNSSNRYSPGTQTVGAAGEHQEFSPRGAGSCHLKSCIEITNDCRPLNLRGLGRETLIR
jgi:hypothetical protein